MRKTLFYEFISNFKKCSNIVLIFVALSVAQKALADTRESFFPEETQQQIAITGTVTDELGDPLPGVNVLIKGTTQGTTTNEKGVFSLSVPNSSAVLIISYIGYATSEITVGNQRTINVTLSEDFLLMDEVVVIAYGTANKGTMSGSISTVASKELVTTKNPNVQNMITGKLPGVRNIQKTAEPGVFTNQFDIRGMGDPLIVIDGVPRGDLPRMDANDIESITVLKDASAAIYGMRAANGVVLITTKSGEKGKARIEYSGYYGIQTPAEMLKPLNAWDRAILYNETTMRNTTSPVKEYGPDYFEQLRNGALPDTDWYGALMRNAAPQQQHNVSVRGGSDRADYYVNLGYTDQGSFWVTNSSNYQRYNVRSNLNVQITNDLKASIKLNMIMDETNRQNMSSWEVFKMLWRSKPNDPVYANNQESYFFHPDVEFNPLASIMPNVSGFVKDIKNIFQSNFSLEYKIPYIKGLKAEFMYSYDKTFNDNTNFRKEYKEYRYNAVTESYDGNWTRNSKTQLTRYYSNSYSTLWNFRLNYNNTFKNHTIGSVLVYEERYSQDYNFQAMRYFEIPIPYLLAGNTENQEGTGSGLNQNSSKALAGRLNYDYGSKYLGEFSFRYDGSSKFPKGKQWGFFPSVLIGYRISEEAFIKDNIPFLNNLKIRATWGQLGDDNASSFQFVEGFDYPASGHNKERIPRGYVFGDSFVNALGFRNAPNPDITWYSATTKNIGIDAELWRGLLGFTAEIFQRDRKNLLANPTAVVPGTFGSGLSQINYNADRNKGFEVELKHRNRINAFNYNVTGFVQMTRSMITKRVQNDRTNSFDYWRNNEINRYGDIWFAYAANGVYKSWDQIYNSIYAGAGTLPGDPIYVDWNGDGVLNADDRYPFATTTGNDRNYPLMNFGLTLNGSWKGIDFNLLFQGASMSYVGYSEQIVNPLTWDGNALDYLFDRWHPDDPDIDPYDPSAKWISGVYPYGKTRADTNSEFNIQNGTYLRLKSAEIGYTLPKNIVSDKLGVKSVRVYVNAYNLLTLSGVISLDPEKPAETYGYLYPLNRTFNFGGSISF